MMGLMLSEISSVQWRWHNLWAQLEKQFDVTVNGHIAQTSIWPLLPKEGEQDVSLLNPSYTQRGVCAWAQLSVNDQPILMTLNQGLLSLCDIQPEFLWELPNTLLSSMLKMQLQPLLENLFSVDAEVKWLGITQEDPDPHMHYGYGVGLRLNTTASGMQPAISQFFLTESFVENWQPPVSHAKYVSPTLADYINQKVNLILGETLAPMSLLKKVEKGDILLVLESGYPQQLTLEVNDNARFLVNKENLQLLKIVKRLDDRMVDHEVKADMAAGDMEQLDNSNTVEVNGALCVDHLPVRVTFELARQSMTFSQLQSISEGYCFELDSPEQTPIEVRANGKLIGECELVKVSGRLGARITKLKQEVAL